MKEKFIRYWLGQNTQIPIKLDEELGHTDISSVMHQWVSEFASRPV
jgi:hypothetical protein